MKPGTISALLANHFESDKAKANERRTLIYFPLYFSQLLIYFLLWWSELVTSVFEVSGAVMAFMSRNGRVSGLRLRA